MNLSVTIATRDRREELARTLAALAALDPPPGEILVCADGCTDGTAEMVRARFPAVRRIEHAAAQGSIRSRNELIAAAGGDWILSLDDDSHPAEGDFVARAAALVAGRERMAVAMFPQRSEEFPESLGQADFGPSRPAGSYANSGALLRRETFLALGGYPGFFGHAYEEPDFALRCWAGGWEVRFEPCATVRHYWTATGRSEERIHRFHARNEFWSVLMRCPMPWALPVAGFRLVRQFGYAARRGPGWLAREPLWWREALAGAGRALRERRPVPWEAYFRWMRLLAGKG